MSRSDIMREYVLAQVGAPYVFGARGQKCTPSYRGGISASTKAEHSSIVSKCQVLCDNSYMRVFAFVYCTFLILTSK